MVYAFFRVRPEGRRGSFRLVVNRLYYNTDDTPEASFTFDEAFMRRCLDKFYKQRKHALTDVQQELFDYVRSSYNQAVDKAFPGNADKDITLGIDPEYKFYQALRYNNGVFSAFKVHRMQSDMVSKLRDEDGNLKPFEQWYKDVLPIADHQCRKWLNTEYNTAVLRAQQAADWRRFIENQDIFPNLKWLPSTSPTPGKDHLPFWNIVRPVNDEFWNQHRPGDRWNCKCDLRATTEPVTELPPNADEQQPHPGLDNNPGKDAKLFSNTHPYIAKAGEEADEAVKARLLQLYEDSEYYTDKPSNGRLTVSFIADDKDLTDNVRAARAILASFEDAKVFIRPDFKKFKIFGHKNPEYRINGLVADRKGIMSEKGVTAAFKSAIKQGCECVVLDLDMYMENREVKPILVANAVYGRYADFRNGIIKRCYIVYKGKATSFTADIFNLDNKNDIKDIIIDLIMKIAK